MAKLKYLPRHKKGFIICHWLNGISFLMLFLTALPLYIPSFGDFYRAVGPHNLQLLHRFFACVFIATPFVGLFIAREGYKRLFSEALHFTKDDIEFQKKFPAELVGGEPDLPPQGFYNGGEKMNILLQMGLWCVLVASGLVLWLGTSLPQSLQAWAIPIHAIAGGCGFAAALGHIYLALGVNPESFQGMKDGTVKTEYAVHHHGKWVDELVATGKVDRKDIE